MADIFVSYKKEERSDAEVLIKQLERAGFSVWWDDRIDPHNAWDDTIELAINDAKAVVVLWTPLSVSSEWVRTEAHFGSNNKKLVPVLLKQCTIPLAFSLVQAVDLTRWNGDGNDPQWRKCQTWVADLIKSHDRRVSDSKDVEGHDGDLEWRERYGSLLSGEAIIDGVTVGKSAPAGMVFCDGKDMPVMRVVSAGRFRMGSPITERERRETEGPVHWVTIPEPFAIGIYPVTFAQWDMIAEGRLDHVPNDHSWGRGDQPVIDVSWYDATAFANALSAITGAVYRLPSEAEWEYGCRGGAKHEYPEGRDLQDDLHSYKANSDAPQPVGKLASNEFGLHDMCGNVREWTGDLWHNNYVFAPSEGETWVEGDGSMRVTRGGSWMDGKAGLRCASRMRATVTERAPMIGMRLVREI